MVANVGPADWNYDETLSTLRYANRAKNIKNKPKINEDPKDAMLREYQQEIFRLKNALAQREPCAGPAMATLTQDEMNRMRQEIEDQLKSCLSLTGTIQLSHTQIAQVCKFECCMLPDFKLGSSGSNICHLSTMPSKHRFWLTFTYTKSEGITCVTD